MAAIQKTYHNCLDVCLSMESGEADSVEDQFRKLLLEYFFPEAAQESKKIIQLIENMDVPPSVVSAESIYTIDIEKFDREISNESFNASLSGKIFLSEAYLKAFYPHSSPSFAQLHDDDKTEIIEKIKQSNQMIVNAFRKVGEDLDADSRRTVLTLVALIIKNIHLTTGRALGKPDRPVKEIISGIYAVSDEVFTASQKQMAQLKDDSSLKQLIKVFFPIKQFKEITEIADQFKKELARYEKRALAAVRLNNG